MLHTQNIIKSQEVKMLNFDELTNLEGKIMQDIGLKKSGNLYRDSGEIYRENKIILSFSPEGHEIEITYEEGYGGIKLNGQEVDI